MAPAPWFLNGMCCQDKGHHTNFNYAGYADQIVQQVDKLAEVVQDQIFLKRTTSFRVVTLPKLLSAAGDKSGTREHMLAFIKNDQVHLNDSGLRVAAGELVRMAKDQATNYINPKISESLC